MGKSRLLTGIAIGAVVGGLVSLLNGKTRRYVKGQYLVTKSQVNYYAKHPSLAVRHAQNYVNQFQAEFTKGADQAINALEQVEQTIGKLTNNN